MDLTDFKKNLKELVWKNTTQAIDRILQVIRSDSDHYNSVILLKASIQDNLSTRNIGTQEQASLNVELKTIRSALLNTIDALRREDLSEKIETKTYEIKQSIKNSKGESNGKMSWETMGRQISRIISLLNHLNTNHFYTPTVIIGISNGGCVISDIISSSLFKGYSIPVVSLWANRWQNVARNRRNYFDNIYNNNLIETLVDNTLNEQISILLVDDVVRTSKTFFQVKDYLYEKIGSRKELEILFLPLFIVNQSYLENAHNELVFGFRDREFNSINQEDYFENFTTRYKKLPWGKILDLENHPISFNFD